LWPRHEAQPSIDFSASAILALRVYDSVSDSAAAPRVLARDGLTFVIVPPGRGPLHATELDRVVLYAVPLDGGPVRSISFEASATAR
jgi:hypothetical protein